MPGVSDLILEFDEQPATGSVTRRFAQVVRRFGDRAAVIHGSQRMTYAELDHASNRIANWLLAQPGPADDPVALLFEHGIGVVVAILGVLKAGCAFCALEPFAPVERGAVVLDDLQSRLILTEPAKLAHAVELSSERCRAVDITAAAADCPTTDPQLDISPHALAAICYTSGSTGTPKGVERTQGYYVMRAALDVEFHETRADDVLSMLTSTSYGSAVTNMFTALLSGAALCLYDLKQAGAVGLTDWIIRHGLTQLYLPNTALRIWSESLADDVVFESIRCLRPSFRLYTRDIESLWQHLPAGAFIVHGLSASEAGKICRCKLRRDTLLDGDIVPVGYPLAGVEIMIVDDAGQPVNAGEVGEIWVRSPLLTERYWRRPELTTEKFIPDPRDHSQRVYRLGDLGRLWPDGCLELVGRKDFQVKIRGYRVELEEVERALERFATVRQAVVIAESDAVGEKRMIAYVVLADPAAGSVQSLRHHLSHVLPEYMIPYRFVILDALPLLPNGKVDRRALPAPGKGRPVLDIAYVAPRTPYEEALCRIWSEVLDIEAVGVDDAFLELGGNSLQATRIASRVLHEFQVDLSLHALFSQPTVATMAGILIHAAADTERLLAELEAAPQ